MIFLPPELSLWAASGLIVLSFLASMMAAVIGLGGGVLMLAAFANLLPAAAIVPVHAVVQLGSNAGRAWMLWDAVDKKHLLPFLIGSALGVALGASVYAALPVDLIRLILGLYILITIWLPLPFLDRLGKGGIVAGGSIAAFLTMFIGATGPFVAAIWQSLGLTKTTKVATHAAAMVLQHGIKIMAFGVLGFAFGPWLPWIALLVLAGVGGTYVGTKILARTSNEMFEMAFKWTLTVMAIGIIWQSLR